MDRLSAVLAILDGKKITNVGFEEPHYVFYEIDRNGDIVFMFHRDGYSVNETLNNGMVRPQGWIIYE